MGAPLDLERLALRGQVGGGLGREPSGPDPGVHAGGTSQYTNAHSDDQVCIANPRSPPGRHAPPDLCRVGEFGHAHGEPPRVHSGPARWDRRWLEAALPRRTPSPRATLDPHPPSRQRRPASVTAIGRPCHTRGRGCHPAAAGSASSFRSVCAATVFRVGGGRYDSPSEPSSPASSMAGTGSFRPVHLPLMPSASRI